MNEHRLAGVLFVALCVGLLAGCGGSAIPSVGPATPTVTVAAAPSPVSPTAQPTIPPASYPVDHQGRALLTIRDEDLWRMRPDGSGEQRLSQGGALKWWRGGDPGRDLSSNPPLVSPNGRWLALAFSDYTRVLDLATLAWREVYSDSTVLDWAPDSHALAYMNYGPYDWALNLYDPFAAQSEYLVGQVGRFDDIKGFLWAPDSRAIAYRCCFTSTNPLGGPVFRIDPATRQVDTMGDWEASGKVSLLCWSADGRIVPRVSDSEVREGARCAPPYRYSQWISPDGTRTVNRYLYAWKQPSQPGCRISVSARGGNGTAPPQWEREFPDMALDHAFWSPDGEYLLLDDYQAKSPVWRLRADGTGDLEVIAQDSYLVDVIAAWQ